ncbi:glycoside hydrolase family 125 protein [Francisella sp. 19X1-34]|uniref:glycoside hydrolase family 125 protein n=1 Tax=Francisella sp. 19X1-34 TaxID=3087177 RepID=UPI002E315F55|nr:glycoside hydrolase family 125 protein [Francisella sp. 19X1-34]MED7787870.1 glycoside hydrolase family 125 protein [Francisella sp. 19X1-34]
MSDSLYNYDKASGKVTTDIYTSDEIVNQLGSSRPEKRLFTSDAVDNLIEEVKTKANDKELARLFENCFPNTLDTTVYYDEDSSSPDTYVITGDIDAMWLRDSTAQVTPYISFVNKDNRLKKMIEGVINRQSKYILIDPYANAFNKADEGSPWQADFTDMKPELHERKWELDSLCSHIRLSYMYYQKVEDSNVFNTSWLESAKLIYKTFKDQQRKDSEKDYSFQRVTPVATDTLADNGLGYPVNPVGLIASSFRPSDDATILPFLIPANFYAVTSLKQLAEISSKVYRDLEFADQCNTLAEEVTDAIYDYGVVEHKEFGKIFAYEVDGFGSHILMDDANVPSLISLPYLGCLDKSDGLYQNTRKFLLSKSNPWYFDGKDLAGIGSIHTGRGYVWPIAIVIQALTSKDLSEIKKCIEYLKNSHAGTYFMHEGINKDNQYDYTRKWFAWANTLFGELLYNIWDEVGF